jgi:hypothetical protein
MKLKLLIPFLLLAACSSEQTPSESLTAEDYLTQMTEIMIQGMVHMEFSSHTDLSKLLPTDAVPAGTTPSMRMKGKMTFGRREGTHQEWSGTLEMQTEMPSVGESTTFMRMVADLKTVWLDQLVQPLDKRQVMRFSWKTMEAMGNEMKSMSMQSLNPAEQIQSLSKFMDFEITETSGNHVTLSATIEAEKFSKAMGQPMPPGMEAMTVEIHLDKSSGLPTRMLTSTAKGVFMTMEFHKIEKLTTVDPALFVYTPPSDVPVVDMDKVFADRDHHHE